MIPNGDQGAAAFLASEPDYDEPAWIDAYAQAIGRCKPELGITDAFNLAREAFVREGDWNNPKVAAGCDAVFGVMERQHSRTEFRKGPYRVHPGSAQTTTPARLQ